MKADSKLKDIIAKEINSFLDKAEKVYLGTGEEPPERAKVEVGPRQGRFYRPEELPESTKQEVGSISLLGKKFKEAGFSLYQVGGSVRDTLLGKESSDLDFTTDATPEQTKKVLTDAGLGRVYTVGQGEKHGTVALHLEDGKDIEITTFRTEVYPDKSRQPRVTFGKDLKEDLARRDFTINAMAQDVLTGELIDPFHGQEDLKAGVIRAVGSAKDRYNEDPLRMLRAVRFACRYGFELDTEMPNPERLNDISKERISSELNKILTSERPVLGVELLKKFGLMKYILPEIEKTYDVEQNKAHYADVYNHTLDVVSNASRYKYDDEKDKLVLMLAALLHDVGKPDTKTGQGEYTHFYNHEDKSYEITKDVLKRLNYDNDTTDRVSQLVSYHMRPLFADPTPKAVNRLVRDLGDKDTRMLIDLAEADSSASNNPVPAKIKQFRETLANTSIPKEKIASPISGSEIMNHFSLSPGRLVGKVKDYLTDKVTDGELGVDDKDKAFELAEKFIKEQDPMVKSIYKSKVYFHPEMGQRPPEGIQVFRGKKGGYFYNVQGKVKGESSGIRIESTNKFGKKLIGDLESTIIKWNDNRSEYVGLDKEDRYKISKSMEIASECLGLIEDLAVKPKYEEQLGLEKVEFLQCKDDKNIYGGLMISRDPEGRKIGRLELLFTSPEAIIRKVRGVGSALLYNGIKKFYDEGIETLVCMPEPTAKGFYEKLGFKYEGMDNMNMRMDRKRMEEFLSENRAVEFEKSGE